MRQLSPLAQKFHDYLKYSQSPRTAYNYARNVDSFLRFVNKPLEKVTPSDITGWYSQLEGDGYSSRTIWRYGWALRSFFDLMDMREMRKKTPIVSAEITEPKWLDEAMAFKVIGRVPVLCAAYDLALRVGEVPLLKISEFNADTGDIVVTRLKHKGHVNTYTLKLDRWCLEILNRYLGFNRKILKDTMFPLNVLLIQKIFTSRAASFGLRGYTFHSLRHSRITHIAVHQLEEKGVVDELSLSKFSGHLRPETTRLYVHLATKYLAFGRRATA